MSTNYNTEPLPTATVLVHTTAGPLTISLFAQQTPLTCRNFLQHCLDGTYNSTIFHRIAPNFVIQTGDPTNTGSGGTNIYEDDAITYGPTWGKLLRLPEERYSETITFSDEIHSRLKFNRRGLIGMAKMSDSSPGQYGSQWFITLADNRAELDGKCTMFGRVEGDGIYNVMKIANGELQEGTERPIYPEKVTSIEVLEWPAGEVWKLSKRIQVATVASEKKVVKKKKKAGKALLSFDADDGEEVVVKKAKFNTALIDEKTNGTENVANDSKANGNVSNGTATESKKRKSPSPRRREPSPKRRKPSFHEPTTQLPLRNPESPSNSPSPEPIQVAASRPKTAASLEAEIASLKASMRRDTASAPSKAKKLSALEAMIPATSTRGRKRPRPGETSDSSSLKLLNAFKARLEHAGSQKQADKQDDAPKKEGKAVDEEALCDLHFIANCQSCKDWVGEDEQIDDADTGGFLRHELTFEKDRLGKDLKWKQKNEEELLVIDPREREKELGVKTNRDRRKK